MPNADVTIYGIEAQVASCHVTGCRPNESREHPAVVHFERYRNVKMPHHKRGSERSSALVEEPLHTKHASLAIPSGSRSVR